MARGRIRCTRAAPDTTANGIILFGPDLNRLAVELLNVGTVDVYVGESGVATTTGPPLFVGSQPLYVGCQDELYGITTAGTGDVAITELLGR